MDCIKPGHRTRQGPGQDGQCQQAAEIDKTKEEAAETLGSTPAAASTTLKIEASNGLPGFRRADLWCYLASQMAEIGLTPFWLFTGSAAIKFHCREAPRDEDHVQPARNPENVAGGGGRSALDRDFESLPSQRRVHCEPVRLADGIRFCR